MQKVSIDFQILYTYDPRVIIVADTSMWGHIEDKPSIIEITVPGSKTAIVKYFEKGTHNVFNSINLEQSCKAPCDCEELMFLDDGVYKITIKGSPDTFYNTKYYMHTASTQLKLDELYVKANLACENINPQTRKDIEEIEFLLKSAEANTRLSNITDAQALLFKAQGKLERMEGCKLCQ
jgi:sulfur relay (sulfurtransferase) DsrF/TusC family protein